MREQCQHQAVSFLQRCCQLISNAKNIKKRSKLLTILIFRPIHFHPTPSLPPSPPPPSKLKYFYLFFYQQQQFFYSQMKKSEGTGAQNCDCDQDPQNLLSYRLGHLNLFGAGTKSLSSLLNPSPPPSKQNNESQVLRPREQNKLDHSTPKQKTSEKDFQKKARLKRTSCPRKSPISLDRVKIFQATESAKGGKAVLTEVKDINIREFTGRGLLVLPNNKKYEGQWVDGIMIGQVKITTANGDIYVGDVYQYEKHGKGYLYFSNGEKYVGEFSCGDCHGEGTLYDREGKVIFEGEWRRGRMWQQ